MSSVSRSQQPCAGGRTRKPGCITLLSKAGRRLHAGPHMAVEPDHLFILVSAGGEEANGLTAFGLTEGPANAHPGQGTACRRFFFANFYLELLWVCDPCEAQSGSVLPLRLWERWERRASGVCPFGLALRPSVPQVGGIPFTSWEYRPAYLPAPLSIHVAANSAVLTEPMLFYLPFALRTDRYPGAKRPPFSHRVKLRELTRMEFVSPRADRPSPELAALAEDGVVRLRTGQEYLVELGFGGESLGRAVDFRPLLPLLFCW